jgi:hypothetical protein
VPEPRRPRGLPAAHVGIGLGACILQWFGHGVGRNAEFDLIIALGIGIGVAFERIETSWLAHHIGTGRSRDLLLVMLVLRLIVSDRQGSALVLFRPEFRLLLQAGQQTVRDEAAQVAAIQGDVFCHNKVVCRAAGKATDADIAALLKQRHISVFVSDPKTMASSVDTSVSRMWLKRN